jgi:prepilin-type N-terminal cleavage/methylation domain-containing protein
MRAIKSSAGFTLIELLVVIAIIGILAAIAIPQFSAYRKRSFEAQVKADLHNAAVAEEAYFVNNNTYISGVVSSTNLTGFNNTTAVQVSSTGGTSTFELTATHLNCGAAVWTYTSQGGSISPSACP